MRVADSYHIFFLVWKALLVFIGYGVGLLAHGMTDKDFVTQHIANSIALPHVIKTKIWKSDIINK